MHGFTVTVLDSVVTKKPLGLCYEADATCIHPCILQLANAGTDEPCAAIVTKTSFLLRAERIFSARREVAVAAVTSPPRK
jgi:hypothetical protein